MVNWKSIKDYEGLYEISDIGDVKILKTGLFLKQRVHNSYYHINLTKKHDKHGFYVHRLVATHFIDNPENKKIVDHIDHNKLNNNIDNLRWLSHTENANHYYNNHYASHTQPILQFDLKKKLIKEWKNILEVFEQFPNMIKPTIMNKLNSNRGESYHGYRWKWKNYDEVIKNKPDRKSVV